MIKTLWNTAVTNRFLQIQRSSSTSVCKMTLLNAKCRLCNIYIFLAASHQVNFFWWRWNFCDYVYGAELYVLLVIDGNVTIARECMCRKCACRTLEDSRLAGHIMIKGTCVYQHHFEVWKTIFPWKYYLGDIKRFTALMCVFQWHSKAMSLLSNSCRLTCHTLLVRWRRCDVGVVLRAHEHVQKKK